MSLKTFILEKNTSSTFYIYGSADSFASPIATTSNITQEATSTILLNVECGTETIFKVKGISSALSLQYEVTNKAIQFEYTDLDRVYVSLPFDYNTNFYIETRFKLMALENIGAFMGMHSSNGLNCYFGSNVGVLYSILGSTGGNITGSNIALDTWYKYKMEFDGTAHTLKTYFDDILVKTLGVGSISATEVKFPIGKFGNSTSNVDGTWQIDWIDLNGKLFNMDSILFDCVVDDSNTPYVVESTKADFQTMLV